MRIITTSTLGDKTSTGMEVWDDRSRMTLDLKCSSLNGTPAVTLDGTPKEFRKLARAILDFLKEPKTK